MDEITVSELIKDLAAHEPPALNAQFFNIAVIFNHDKKPGKNFKRLARIFKIADAIKPITTYNGAPVDFVIEYFLLSIEQICPKEGEHFDLLMRRVTLHELMHIAEDGKLIPHDTQDFRYLLEKYGMDWMNGQLSLFDQKQKGNENA